jgi:AraC-like DNA-binding protein
MTERLYIRLDEDPLYAPETSVPRGTLRDLRVPPELGLWVAHVVAYEEDVPAGEVARERVLPDGSMHLVFEFDGGSARSRVAGPRLRPSFLMMQGQVRGLSVKLRPGAAQALFSASAHELANDAVGWSDLVRARDRCVPDRLQEADSDRERLAVLTRALLGMRRDSDDGGWMKARRARELLGAPMRPSVQSAAEAVGVSERRLQQLFQSHVGLSPGEWRRLARLHDCLRKLRSSPQVCWASLAVECGFYDQSHLVRDFTSVCGLTPTEFLRRRSVPRTSKTAA